MGHSAAEHMAVGGGVVLDVCGVRVNLGIREVRWLLDAATANAGRSSVARDLGVLLDVALAQHRVVVLRSGERRELRQLALQAGLPELAQRLVAEASSGRT